MILIIGKLFTSRITIKLVIKARAPRDILRLVLPVVLQLIDSVDILPLQRDKLTFLDSI
jgi:hypothetical protein